MLAEIYHYKSKETVKMESEAIWSKIFNITPKQPLQVITDWLKSIMNQMEPIQSRLISTGGSHLSRTVVKPDSRLARIFVAKFLCIIKLIIIIG